MSNDGINKELNDATGDENTEKKVYEVEEEADCDKQSDGADEEEAAENNNVEEKEERDENVQEPSDTEQAEKEEKDENVQEPSDTEQAEKEESGKHKININFKKIAMISAIVVAALGAVYMGGVAYYSGHFLPNTQLGRFKCANMSVEQTKAVIEKAVSDYDFTFYEKEGKTETIKGEEIYFTSAPVDDNGIEKAQKSQNPFEWVLFKKQTLPLDMKVDFNKDALYNKLTEMDFMAETRQNMDGSVAGIYYEDGSFKIKDDGTKPIVSLNNVFDRVQPKILEMYRGMSLEKENCYQGLADDDNMKGVLNLLNKYAGTKVTYLNSANGAVLDGETINQWLNVSDDYAVTIDKEKVRDYINNLAKNYDNVGKERTFKTTGGSEIKVSGGNYGWIMDNEKETNALMDIITTGESVEREPIYKQKAAAHGANDIGNTYVEVSIGGQHLWYYKDGKLITSTDVVTGNVSAGHSTPTGVYRIAFKDKDAILRGEGYESPVSYWMPFNGGVGLHDATWRGAFGGSIYRGSGSHGCVNMPFSAAKTVFESINPGDPVIVY